MRYVAVLVVITAIAILLIFSLVTEETRPRESFGSTVAIEPLAGNSSDDTDRGVTIMPPAFEIKKVEPLPSFNESLLETLDIVRQESARKLTDQSQLISGEATSLELEELFFSSTDNVVAASLLANILVRCHALGPGQRMALEQTCVDLLAIKTEYDKGRDQPYHPFFELEKAALAGDIFARYEYWDALRAAVATNTINPLTAPDSWIWRRDQAIAWRLYFAQIGVQDAASLLAIDYWEGRLVSRNILYAIVLSQRALDIGGANHTLQRFIDLARSEYTSSGGDESEIESVHRHLFGR